MYQVEIKVRRSEDGRTARAGGEGLTLDEAFESALRDARERTLDLRPTVDVQAGDADVEVNRDVGGVQPSEKVERVDGGDGSDQ